MIPAPKESVNVAAESKQRRQFVTCLIKAPACTHTFGKLWLNWTSSFYCHSPLFLTPHCHQFRVLIFSWVCQQVWLLLVDPFCLTQGRCHSWTCTPTSTHTHMHERQKWQTSVEMWDKANISLSLLRSFLICQAVCLFFSRSSLHLYTHTQTHTQRLNWLVSFNQTRNKRIPASLKLTSLMGLGVGWGGNSVDKRRARSGRLKMHFHFGRDVSFLIPAPLCQHLFASGSNFHYRGEQRGVQDFVVLMERDVTSIMHFLLEDATHGHTWPCVRARWTGRGWE